MAQSVGTVALFALCLWGKRTAGEGRRTYVFSDLTMCGARLDAPENLQRASLFHKHHGSLGPLLFPARPRNAPARNGKRMS